MDIDQRRVIRRLERAFKACRDEGLVFAGVDMALMVCAVEHMDGFMDECPLNAFKDVDGDTVEVNTSGTYIDSGGA